MNGSADAGRAALRIQGEAVSVSDIKTEEHPDCIACSPSHGTGLHLCFTRSDDGGVEAEFGCGNGYAGFPGIVHGGIVAMLLDSAMTNCLFTHGHSGFTAELTLRFRRPVMTNCKAIVRAHMVKSVRRLYLLEAELVQGDVVKATARAKFMARRRGTGQVKSRA